MKSSLKGQIRNRIFPVILSAIMLFSFGGTAFAADESKPSETVYVLLDTAGSVREVIVKSDGVEVKGTNGELPFAINISYKLNGETVAPAEIIGKSGDVKITIDIASNSKAKAYFKENLALQMQFPINMGADTVTNIVADGLTGVNVGYTKTLSGIVLPAKSAKYEISYTTKSFVQQSVNFVCMPFDLTGMTDLDVSAIGAQVGELQKAIGQYVAGVDEVSKGLSVANAGVKKISSSGEALVGGYAQTVKGETQLLQAMLASLPAAQQKAFEPQIKAIQAGQKQISDSISQYSGGVSQSSTGLAQLDTATKELAKNGNALKEGINSAIAPLSSLSLSPELAGTPEAFFTNEKVSDIQFVMKTDALTTVVEKQDVLPAQKPKKTFWSRLLALFGG